MPLGVEFNCSTNSIKHLQIITFQEANMKKLSIVQCALIGALVMTSFNGHAEPNPQQLMSSNCSGCHSQDKMVFGPSWSQISGRYNASDADRLASVIRLGNKGKTSWGPIWCVGKSKLTTEEAYAIAATLTGASIPVNTSSSAASQSQASSSPSNVSAISSTRTGTCDKTIKLSEGNNGSEYIGDELRSVGGDVVEWVSVRGKHRNPNQNLSLHELAEIRDLPEGTYSILHERGEEPALRAWAKCLLAESASSNNVAASQPSSNFAQNSNANSSGKTASINGRSTTGNNTSSQINVGNQRDVETPVQGQSSGPSADQCVSLQEGKYNETRLQNDCSKAIQVQYCVDNPRSLFKCGKIGGGMLELKPGRSFAIVDYKKAGGGDILWVACVSPQTPRGWRYSKNSKYDCR